MMTDGLNDSQALTPSKTPDTENSRSQTEESGPKGGWVVGN